jgi:hypothetical protein
MVTTWPACLSNSPCSTGPLSDDSDANESHHACSEACNKDVPVVLIDMHSCSLDEKIRMTLEAQVVEKTVEVASADRKKSSAKGGGNKDAKRKRSPTAFFLFMYAADAARHAHSRILLCSSPS